MKKFFYNHVNKDGQSPLTLAAMCSDNLQCIAFVNEETVAAMIGLSAETPSSFFYFCCFFGQYTALKKIYEMLKTYSVDDELKKTIYTAALVYDNEVSLLEAC